MKKLIYVTLILLSFNAIANDSLTEHKSLVKSGKEYVTLLGTQVEVGQKAPDFKVSDKNFSPIKLSNFKGKKILISVVPSVDTGVCSLQTKRFNDEMVKAGENTVMITISNDLPFAQKRFCESENVKEIQVLSDAVWHDFGSKYGLLIKDMGLLARSIFIVNSEGKVIYKEIVQEITDHPDYEKALSALKNLS